MSERRIRRPAESSSSHFETCTRAGPDEMIEITPVISPTLTGGEVGKIDAGPFRLGLIQVG
jgi:hypothetical protein